MHIIVLITGVVRIPSFSDGDCVLEIDEDEADVRLFVFVSRLHVEERADEERNL